jgi:predicted DNA-binding protein (MmcQ/YjbR family)
VVFDVSKVEGIGGYEQVLGLDFSERSEKSNIETYATLDGKVFLVVNPNSVEVRTDKNLRRLLVEKYESVMESRYFGKGGVEVVLSGQISSEEIDDLVRLSYNLSIS